MQTKIFIMYFYILFLSFIFISCANIASPTGGEGKNKVPTIIKCSIQDYLNSYNYLLYYWLLINILLFFKLIF